MNIIKIIFYVSHIFMNCYVFYSIINSMDFFFKRRICNKYINKVLIIIFSIIIVKFYNVINFNVGITFFAYFLLAAILFYKELNLKKIVVLISITNKLIAIYAISHVFIYAIYSIYNINSINKIYIEYVFYIIYIFLEVYLREVIFKYINLSFEKYNYKMLIVSGLNIIIYSLIGSYIKQNFINRVDLAFLVVIYIESSTVIVNMLKNDINILKYKNKVYKNNNEYAKNQKMELKIIKHDLKNHIIIITNYLKNNDNDKAIDYLNKLNVELDQTNYISFCGNDIINSLISSKYEYIKRNNIKLNLNIAVNDDINILSNDLCAIFGNLFDNAIDGCMKVCDNKFLEVNMYIKKNILFINIKNSSCIGKYKKYKKLITNKIDKKNHGFGHISVNNIIKKYNGNIVYENKDNIFIVNSYLILK